LSNYSFCSKNKDDPYHHHDEKEEEEKKQNNNSNSKTSRLQRLFSTAVGTN
jgi:hypothetical protein